MNDSNIKFYFTLRVEIGPDGGGEAANPTVSSPVLMTHTVATPGAPHAIFSGAATCVVQTDSGAGSFSADGRDVKILLTGKTPSGQKWNWDGSGNGVHSGLLESPRQSATRFGWRILGRCSPRWVTRSSTSR